MASAAAAVPTQTPCIVFDSGKAGLISIVEEELPTDVESPLASPSPQAPTWRKVDYFGKLETKSTRGLGIPSASGTGSPLASNPRRSSPETSPRLASPRISIAGWGMIPPRYTPHLGTNSQYSHAELWSQASPKLPQLSSVIPDISDDEASRHGSIAELEIFLRKASIVQSLTEKGSGTKSDIEILISEESSDVLGPLHSPLTPLTPSIRTSASPRASSECLGKTSSHEDQNVTNATTPKRPHLDRASVFKHINNFADLHSFSFRQAPKAHSYIGGWSTQSQSLGFNPTHVFCFKCSYYVNCSDHVNHVSIFLRPHYVHIRMVADDVDLHKGLFHKFCNNLRQPEPAYQEALAGVEEDPDFVEVEIKSKAGSISRRASLLANVFTNQDVDVDPDLKFEPSASEAEIKQGIAQAQNERSLRKMAYSRNFAIASLAMINAFCIALSFGLFSVWYATAPLILAAPLLRSTMVVDLLIGHTYKKARLLLRPQREEPEVPAMDYATVISFSNESFEDIQSTLDSLVDQKDVDMHKNLLLISCNDNVWNSDYAKSTTRIILEHILTNIVDEAKFRMPRDGPGTGYDTMWCRRGIYKGLPYVLMVKEGVTKRTDVLDLSRNLLHAYNLRKESYFNSVPSAFFAWYKEWAELHDFASFDFLVNISSESILDEHCISQLYSQFLQSPTCVAVSSRVEIDPRSSRWSIGNLFSNSHLMYDQVRSSHQTQIMQKTSRSVKGLHS
ncbi:hypothetical protein E4T49_07697 [Aureobasidium sp. EXF-10728]|nr:hypothetical protein E4T49_07697 [Aureobasidium sp. EXF-10728]